MEVDPVDEGNFQSMPTFSTPGFFVMLVDDSQKLFSNFWRATKNVFKNFSRSNCRTSAGLFRSCFRSGRVLVATKQSQPGDSSRDLFIPDRWTSRFHHLKGSRFHQPKRVTSRIARNRSFTWGPRRTHRIFCWKTPCGQCRSMGNQMIYFQVRSQSKATAIQPFWDMHGQIHTWPKLHPTHFEKLCQSKLGNGPLPKSRNSHCLETPLPAPLLWNGVIFLGKKIWLGTRDWESATCMKSVSSCLCAVWNFYPCIHALRLMLKKSSFVVRNKSI